MKKVLTVFLALILILTMIPFAAAEETVYSGTCGENLTWTLDTSTGVLTITGSGDMFEWSRVYYDSSSGEYYSDIPWFSYRGTIYTIIISESISSIGRNAFWGCTNVERIELPSSLQSIGYYAFYGCESLETISIPANVTRIGGHAFENSAFYNNDSNWSDQVLSCDGWILRAKHTIENYAIAEGYSIADSAFSGCTELRSIVLSDGIEVIPAFAFSDCSSLESVTIPSSVRKMEYCSFENSSSIKSVYIIDLAAWCRIERSGTGSYDNPLYPGADLYLNNTLIETLTIPSEVETVGEYTFWGCASIKAVNFEEGVSEIADAAFAGCKSLQTVSFPNSMRHIRSQAFESCSSLKEINIPDSVNSIGFAAFAYCDSLETVVIGDGLSDIHGGETYSIFAYCSNLKNVSLGSQIGEIKKETFDCFESPEYGTINCYESLESVTIKNPTCAIDYDKNTLGVPGKTVIYGYKDSTAEYYAKAFAYTFVPLEEPHEHSYVDTITPPTCTEQGYTTHTCECGDSYVDSYVLALGHDFKNGVCIRCGEVAKDNNPFTDVVAGKYYYDAVVWAYFHDPQITSGTGDTTFSPNATCTRAQIVTFLWRAAGSPEPATTNNPFADVGNDKYYYKAVLWAAEEGITTGTGDRIFSPNSGCTRAQVVTFLWRFAGSPEPITTNNPFSDVPPDKYYTKAVLWASEHEITAGTSETTFSPEMTCTRGQIVTFLYRYMGD